MLGIWSNRFILLYVLQYNNNYTYGGGMLETNACQKSCMEGSIEVLLIDK